MIHNRAEVDPIDYKKRTPLNYALKKKKFGDKFQKICEILEKKGGTTKWN